MGYRTITYEKKDQIDFITLNRPEAANAIDAAMGSELEDVCRQIRGQDDAMVVVISGGDGKAFCSGEDMSSFSDTISGGISDIAGFRTFIQRFNVAKIIAEIECPVIAAINGDTLGAGLALALSCDYRVTSERSRFGVPDVARGYMAASGITQWLPRIVGRGKAMELILTSEIIDAREAYRIGLVHRVVMHEEVFSEAKKLATEIVSRAPLALRYTKEAINKGMDLTLDQGLRLECDLYMGLHTTQDRIEGIKSFREKRQPLFKGK